MSPRAARKTTTKTTTPAAVALVPRPNGRGALKAGGTPGNKGGTGRPPDEFKALCAHLASREETVTAAATILRNPDHPAFLGALKWATENGYEKLAQRHEHSGPGGLPLRFTLELGERRLDGDR